MITGKEKRRKEEDCDGMKYPPYRAAVLLGHGCEKSGQKRQEHVKCK